jgi:small subunit ribosomal protein S8
MISDPIADMLTRIRNAVATKKDHVDLPASKMKSSVLAVMKKEGYISNFTSKTDNKKSFTKIDLKYDSESNSAIKGITRVSTPGLRSYSKKGEVPMYMGGLAVAIISTSQGVMTGKEAYKKGLGGEIICYMW